MIFGFGFGVERPRAPILGGGVLAHPQLGAQFPAGFGSADDAEFNDVFDAADDYLAAVRFGAI